MTLTLLDLAGHFSFALSALSFALRDMLLLRGLAIASGIVGIGYNYSIPAGPLWLVIFWLAVFSGINAARIVGIFAERRAVAFSDEEAELHETLFRDFSPVEFMKLMRVGDWRSAPEGHTFTEQGGDIEGLKLLYNGEVAVTRDGAEIARARDGALSARCRSCAAAPPPPRSPPPAPAATSTGPRTPCANCWPATRPWTSP